jgi:peptidoglycan biosynthesis protein MviN/MurJ (putative lipid II flippase)
MFTLPAMWLVNLGFFALQDTATPFWVTLGLTPLVIGLNIFLAGRMGIQGLALGTVILRSLQFIISLALLRRKLGQAHVGATLVVALPSGQPQGLPFRPILDAALKTALACAALVAVFLAVGTGPWSAGNTVVGQIVYLALMGGLGVAAYVAVLSLLRVEELGLLMGAIQRRAHSLSHALRFTFHVSRITHHVSRKAGNDV